MKILVFSATPWNKNNSFGNSFSSIFSGIENLEIANIVCSRIMQPTDEPMVTKSFFITTKMLIDNLCNPSKKVGTSVFYETAAKAADNMEKGQMSRFAKAKRWMIFFWLRDLIWTIGRWKSKELKEFIDDFKPDLIFQPVYYSSYLNDIALFIKKYTNAPMMGYISDDCYTLKQFSLSPLYWIDRLYKRRKVKQVIDKCETLYVISDIQKKEYDKCFNKDCKILWKGAVFDEKPKYNKNNDGVLKFVYTGNIGAGRYKQLAHIGEAIRLFKDDIKAELDIYSPTPMTKNMEKVLNIPGVINLKGAVSSDKIPEIQRNADVLVHVEGFDLKSRLATRQSFSTKIVDYLYRAKCVFAVGPKDIASIDYLIKNDGAVVATSKEEIKERIKILTDNPDLIEEYGDKAWECGKRNHQIKEIQKKLKEDLDNCLNNYNGEK